MGPGEMERPDRGSFSAPIRPERKFRSANLVRERAYECDFIENTFFARYIDVQCALFMISIFIIHSRETNICNTSNNEMQDLGGAPSILLNNNEKWERVSKMPSQSRQVWRFCCAISTCMYSHNNCNCSVGVSYSCTVCCRACAELLYSKM